MNPEPLAHLRALIEQVEKSYEYLLAYAAQGRRGDEKGGEIRDWLETLDTSLEGLGPACAALLGLDDGADRAFLALLAEDRDRARAVIGVVRARTRISSQLIDNLNASLHLRTLLTDLFLLDERLASD